MTLQNLIDVMTDWNGGTSLVLYYDGEPVMDYINDIDGWLLDLTVVSCMGNRVILDTPDQSYLILFKPPRLDWQTDIKKNIVRAKSESEAIARYITASEEEPEWSGYQFKAVPFGVYLPTYIWKIYERRAVRVDH